MRVGKRQFELCQLLDWMGGESPTQSALYLQLRYKQGGTSNAYGHAVLQRCYRSGLMVGDYDPKTRGYRVTLTDKGRELVS